jgi:hypothetical protein
MTVKINHAKNTTAIPYNVYFDGILLSVIFLFLSFFLFEKKKKEKKEKEMSVIDKEGMRIRGSCNLVADLFKDKENGATRLRCFLEPLVPWMGERLGIPSVIPFFSFILAMERRDKHTLLFSFFSKNFFSFF